MAEQGWAVAVVDRDAEGVDAVVAALAARGAAVLPVVADLTDPEAVRAAVDVVGDRLPPVQALVNNAGITDPTPFADTSVERWRRVFAVNVESQFHTTQAFLPGMVAQGCGRVVTVSSAAGQRGGGYFGGVHYSASKAAVLGMIKALAREYAGTGVTFNAVAPGSIATDITAGALTDERREAIIAATPVRRIGEAAEVAAVIAFLCSSEAAFVTGATYDVNGGSHIH
ncbi:SDR family NAD(P)-dependent oxidoreductase [Nocardioides humi]|nr:SDR family NAD(P)-dependent oxidoreductase [Nocardioides humi]